MDLREASTRYGDVLLAGTLAALVCTELAMWDGERTALAFPGALLMTISLALRRSLPVAAFVVAMSGAEVLTRAAPRFDNDSAGFVVSFFVGLYSIGRHARGREAWFGAVALLVVMVDFVRSEGGAQADAGDLAFVLGFVGAPWAAGLTLRLRREREEVLNAENERLRRDQEELAARAVAEERSLIARELHDVVSHAISVTVLQARGARRSLESDPIAVRDALDAIEQTNTAALGDMRRLLAVLRDTEPGGRTDDAHAPQPSVAHLDALVDQVRRSGAEVELDVTGVPRDVPPGVDLSAYRIVQEALTNVLKHAEAARTRVCVEYADDALIVTVVDRGASSTVATDARGHGLIGIRERVAVVGGDVEAGPVGSGGYRLRARLPYSLEGS